MNIMNVDYDGLIPNNVNLNGDPRVKAALEKWHPGYLDWWNDMGPDGFQESLVYLRTAASVDPKGWAKFDYVKMPDYQWGILLAPQGEDRKIPFGAHAGEKAGQEVPGEYRAMLRRLIVIQGDTEPASVEQQRFLGKTAPSLYDMRNLFQVNVEEGRHLWAMVYLLQKYFGADGREEAEALLQRRSGDEDTPRMLGAFNEETPDWLSFFMFTFFTDRDGKMQLEALAQSGFDPLSRTTRFMLTEEAHHMFVGETGVGRTIERTCQELQKAGKGKLFITSDSIANNSVAVVLAFSSVTVRGRACAFGAHPAPTRRLRRRLPGWRLALEQGAREVQHQIPAETSACRVPPKHRRVQGSAGGRRRQHHQRRRLGKEER